MELPYSQIFFGLALGFDAVALAFVVFGGGEMLWCFLRTPKKKSGILPDKVYHRLRRNFVHRVILALDFFLVADLTKLAFIDTLPGLMQILLIVIIRTILSYFLLKETEGE